MKVSLYVFGGLIQLTFASTSLARELTDAQVVPAPDGRSGQQDSEVP